MRSVETRIKALKVRRSRAYIKHAGAVRDAQQALDSELEDIEVQLRRLEKAAKEPRVLVRNTPGPKVTVFHSAVSPCGKVNPDMVKAGRFDEMPLSDALSRGLEAHGCAAAL